MGLRLIPDSEISIHAPRVGSDQPLHMLRGGQLRISIHAPRVGSDRTYMPW